MLKTAQKVIKSQLLVLLIAINQYQLMKLFLSFLTSIYIFDADPFVFHPDIKRGNMNCLSCHATSADRDTSA